ncbi:MAG: hypothetical protein NTW29_23025 [Bacteroidetes bacterium]|nr:hypothetical protein [Bacteroidota bacterium]
MALNSTHRKILAPLLALGTAIIIINIFQLLAPLAFDPYERVNPFEYSETAESFLPKQVLYDLLGMGIGLFTGAVLCMLLCQSTKMYIVNLVPLVLLLLISLNDWRFWLSKDLLWLLLPVWILLCMAGYYLGRYIHHQYRKYKQSAQGR